MDFRASVMAGGVEIMAWDVCSAYEHIGMLVACEQKEGCKSPSSCRDVVALCHDLRYTLFSNAFELRDATHMVTLSGMR